MRLSKILASSMLSFAIVSSTSTISANTTNSVFAVIDNSIPESVELISKQSFDYDAMAYLVETYSDASIIVKAQFTGDTNKDYYDYDVLSVAVPIGMYNIQVDYNQMGSYADVIERVANGEDVYTYSISYQPWFNFSKGLVATFTLTPTGEYYSDVKLWDKTIELPDITNKNDYFSVISTLKNQIVELEEKVGSDNDDSILKYDISKDGLLDAVDATTILQIYAINSTGGSVQSMDDYYKYIQEQETFQGNA